MSYHDTDYRETFETVKPCYTFLRWSGCGNCYVCNIFVGGGVKLFTIVKVYVS